MRERSTFSRGTLAAALSIATTSCVFLVDSLPDGTSSSCNLSTDASVCAVCIANNCKTQLDACCGDDSCRGILADADECAKDEYCTDLAKAGTSGKQADFVGCIQASCGGSCSGIGEGGTTAGDGSTCAGCDTTCTKGDTGACACTQASSSAPGNSITCPPSNLENPICCSTVGWPSTSGSCECQTLYCSESNGTCQCSIGSYVVGASNETSCFPILTDDICCVNPSTGDCSCGSFGECDTDENQVDECSRTTMTCPTGEARSNEVSECSHRSF